MKEIWKWIAADNRDAADKLARKLLDACAFLVAHPDTGSLPPAWTHRNLRFYLVRRNYWIVYAPETRPLEILRVIHAARNIPAVLARDA
jgi:plasmid stabilization system protein ParE